MLLMTSVVLLFITYSPVTRTVLSVFDRYPHGVITGTGGDPAYFLASDLSMQVGKAGTP